MLTSIICDSRIFCRIVRSDHSLQRQLLLQCRSSSIHPSDELLPLTSSQSSRHHHTSRCSQHRTNRTITTNAAANTDTTTTTTNASLPPIEGTIPLHGKGLKMSQYAEIQRIFTQTDVNLFGKLSGDMNPVHFPREDDLTSSTDAEGNDGSDSNSNNSNNSSEDKKNAPIVHGILLSSLFSNIFGTLIPGAIYRHQSLKFHHVVHVDELVVGRVVVTKLRQINRRGRKSGSGSGGGGVLCTCDTSVIKIVPSAKSNHEDSNSNDGEEEIMTCISGDAQVWLPDLQLVYECREKGG